jgi:hypothetical protein
MTIVSSTSTPRWTNRENLHKDQDSWNKDFCPKGKQNSRFPVRILPTHHDARTRRYRKCKCRGSKEQAEKPFGEEGKVFPFYAIVRDARGCWGYVGAATRGFVQTEHL